MKFIVEIDEKTLAAKVTFPSGEVTHYDHCALSQSREIVHKSAPSPELPTEKAVPAETVNGWRLHTPEEERLSQHYFATGKESLTLLMTSEAQPHRRTEM